MGLRVVSIIPAYLLAVVILAIVGSLTSVYFLRSYIPLGRQEPYIGSAIRWDYKVDQTGNVTINIANVKDYRAKVDIVLIKSSGEVLTSCIGSISSSRMIVNAGVLQLLGIPVEPGEIIIITCGEQGVREVKVFEHGVEVGSRGAARIGRIPSWYGIGDVPFGIGSPWLMMGFGYRIPITIVVTQTYSVVYGELVINQNTVGQTLFNFIHSNTRPDGKDFVVATVDGVLIPTSSQKTGNSITITFELRNIAPGVHRFYLYFGNPSLNQEINPITSNPPWNPRITTPTSGLSRSYLSTQFVYPAYVVPEANWYPDDDDLRHGHLYTTDGNTLNSWVSTITSGSYDPVKQLLSSALSNRRSYPAGTSLGYSDYTGLTPKTVYGNAPWATLTVVPLPSFAANSLVYDPITLLYVASDDGSSAYLVGLRHTEGTLYRLTYFSYLSNAHGPRYAGHLGSSNWNYETSSVSLLRQNIENAELFLVIIQQNGIQSGCCPGWIDIRFVMWWIEKPYTQFGISPNPTPNPDTWLTGWRYRKSLDVLGDSLGPISNYILRVTVRYGNGADSYDTVYCGGKCKSDFSDIRFTTSDGRTRIQYCLAEKVDGQYSIFYIMIQRPAQGDRTRIYVYYGNTQATSESNCQAVFGRNIGSRYGGDGYYDALILSSKEWVSGGSYLCYVGDDGSCGYSLPFTVKVYDVPVSQVHISSNGFIRWDNQYDGRYHNYLDTGSKMIAPHWDDLYSINIYTGTGNDNTLGNYLFITWTSVYYSCRSCGANFQAIIYRNWVIQFNFNYLWSGASPNEFISAGDGANYIDLTPRWGSCESVLFVPKFPTAYGVWGPEEMM